MLTICIHSFSFLDKVLINNEELETTNGHQGYGDPRGLLTQLCLIRLSLRTAGEGDEAALELCSLRRQPLATHGCLNGSLC